MHAPHTAPLGLVVKAPAPRAAGLGSIRASAVGILSKSFIPVTEKLAGSCLLYQAPDVVGLELGVVGLVLA